MMNIPDIKLTEFSPGAGCGCKISPAVLHQILGQGAGFHSDPHLVVGHESKDDAAVYDPGNGDAIISTTDFFMPISDDAMDFGRIAAANAISDVYAMGGRPLMAISILGWPLSKLPVGMASQVLEGAREICRQAGIILAGGHSIDSLEPIFGLAVTGMVRIENLKRNNTARPGDILFLTKPLGTGILTTAEKQKKLRPEHRHLARNIMVQLNRAGEVFGGLEEVTAMTDVTGFGLLGHLLEMCEGSGLRAEIHFQYIPVIEGLDEYIRQGALPGGTFRNWSSYGHQTEGVDEHRKAILCDPQTSGGLLVTVKESSANSFSKLCNSLDIHVSQIGQIFETGKNDARVKVMPTPA